MAPTWLPHGLIDFLLSLLGAKWHGGRPGRGSCRVAGGETLPEGLGPLPAGLGDPGRRCEGGVMDNAAVTSAAEGPAV